MKVKIHYLSLFLFILFLVACSSDSDDKAPETESFDPTAQSSISGSIHLNYFTAVDSDLNDPDSAYSDNSKLSLAQEIENYVQVQGFVTKEPTRNFENEEQQERINDRFYNKHDEFDFFKVELFYGQTIQLHTQNLSLTETDSIFSGDIDLFLYDEKYELVAHSDSITAYDSVTVPQSGFYYISVHANQGASKYLLNLYSAGSSLNQDQRTAINAQRPALDFVNNELIVQFSEQASTPKSAAFSAMQTKSPGKTKPTLARFSNTYASAASTTFPSPALSELASLNPDSYEKLQTLLKRKEFASLGSVKSVSLNYRRYPMAVPSDPLYSDQWHYPAIKLPEAWDITTGTPETGDIIVAVIDTGIFSGHPDLQNKLVSGYDFVSDPVSSADEEPGSSLPNSDIDNNPEDTGISSGWHGTHVAGTIAAESNNNYGVAGVSWGAKIMPIRGIGQFGITSYDLLESLRFAAGLENDSGTLPEQPADIINLSLGGFNHSDQEQTLFDTLYEQGVIVVAAAGNNSSSSLAFPASYNHVISVSALDAESNLTPYSNFGSAIDIAAPGGDMSQDENNDQAPDGVLSTLVDDSSRTKTASFDYLQGTSMAAPHVSGIFALMKAVYPALDAQTAEALLKTNQLSEDIGSTGKDQLYGYGRVNALSAVQAALTLQEGAAIPETPISISATPAFLTFQQFEDSDSPIETSVAISNSGDVNGNITGVSSNQDWLVASYQDALDTGLGTYNVTIDPSELSIGFHEGVLTFSVSDTETSTAQESFELHVAINIIDSDYLSQITDLHIYLHDQLTGERIRQEKAFINQDIVTGDFTFSVDRLKGGSYYLYLGSDIDNDKHICQVGEVCALYPYIENVEPISLAENTEVNIDMTAYLMNFTFSDDNINSITEEADEEEPEVSSEIESGSIRQFRK